MKKTKKIFIFLSIILLIGLTFGCKNNVDGTRSVYPLATQSPTPDILSQFKPNLISDYHTDLFALEDAPSYIIEILVDDALTSYSGKMEVHYTNQEDVNLDEIYFKLVPNASGDNMVITDVIVEDNPVLFSLENENTTLRVDLLEDLHPQDKVLLTVFFQVQVPVEMGGNYGLFIYQDGILGLDSFFPIIPVFQDGRWQIEDPPANADLIFSDAAFFKVTVNSPEDLIWAASGVKDEVLHKEGRQIITFIGGPQRDFYLAGSRNFESCSQKVGDTLVSSYFPPDLADAGLLVLNTAAKALEVFNQRFGQYPYTELDLVSTPMRAGGMEYSTAVALSLDLYEAVSTQTNNTEKSFLESATAHEVAHQWFFNQVMNDQIDEPWLDEGMAQYATYLYYLDTYGYEAAATYRQSWDQRWSRTGMQPIPVGKPADAYTQQEYSSIIYGRAPILIEAIEKEMGENAFNEFIKEYVRSNRWRIVDGQSFFGLGEESCSCNLETLQREWVME